MATYKNGIGVKITNTRSVAEIEADLQLLADIEVLVGFPEESTDRPDEGITNASLGYIHDNGAPEANIPARPFMIPGIQSVEEKLSDKLGQLARAVVVKGGGPAVIEQGMHQIGLIAQLGIQKTIGEGIDPPLSDRTLRARARRGRGNKGALRELDRRWDGQAPSTEYARPLIDTAEMLKSVKYAIRSRRKRGS